MLFGDNIILVNQIHGKVNVKFESWQKKPIVKVKFSSNRYRKTIIKIEDDELFIFESLKYLRLFL